jgi:sulfite reductase alpha subunit-like flavoprotein
LLCSGAAVYIAGSSTKISVDVTAALEEVIFKESGETKEGATKWLRTFENCGKI